MFIGTNYPKLDDKFRLILPAKFRDRLAGGVVLTRGQEHCLVLMTKAEFEARATQVTNGVVFGTREHREINRQFFGDADEQTPDGQGRILITAKLREWANLSKDLVVAGVGSHIEIWNQADHEAFMNASAEAFANFGEVNPTN